MANSETVKLNLRLPKELHEKLVDRARENNTSLNSEILSYIEEKTVFDVAFVDPIPEQIQGLVQLLVVAMDVAGSSRMHFDQLYAADRGPHWVDLPDAYEAAVGAATRVLEALKPPAADGARALAGARVHGQDVAQRILDRVAVGEPESSPSAWRTDYLREKLGPLVKRIKPREDPKE
jgi:hypothetical protein